MVVNDLWFLAEEASQRAERAYQRLRERYSGYLDDRCAHRVSRRRFRTLARRVKRTGAPYGAQTIVSNGGDVLLVRHEGADLWVLPGGEVREGETYREAAVRELREEAGIAADYRGLAVAERVDIRCSDCETWGVLPVFAATAEGATPSVCDPDGEISAARWFPFDDLPADTRDRADLLAWRDRAAP
ncbi:NUDIX domain-containing protein [Halogeometricum sp. S1BR25-6]|uniref:NUDIX domain-containing protein n=1 Tax=Halogeometricum salsisoli TaxID=2950536 RepID=A0ABU2GCN2_9EURY|nr:NUDIX domain-containing protein [Halogeometricum sp. S1BR25-6]MDS0298571.1 NUDIX domain-containing protein [Halogeometricum sp. S1BR25-6]